MDIMDENFHRLGLHPNMGTKPIHSNLKALLHVRASINSRIRYLSISYKCYSSRVSPANLSLTLPADINSFFNSALDSTINIVDQPQSAVNQPSSQLDLAFPVDSDSPDFFTIFMATIRDPDSQDSPQITPAGSQAGPPNPSGPAPPKRRKRVSPKIHGCPVCDLRFPSLRLLGNHMKDAHNLKAFKCDHCDTRVTRYDNLESHKRTCKRQSPNSSVATPETNRGKKGKGPRVSMRSINVRPEPIRSLPKISLHDGPIGVGLVAPSSRKIEGTALQVQPHISQSSNPSDGIRLGGSTNSPTVTSDSQQLEILKLKSQLDKAKWEASHWKENFLLLKYGNSGGPH
ncbi:hypothetical protein TWF102_004817 [Orbilia oligospora]|uniref:C2H2-type domain-containing protein n=1 Tax=Orbilia oligospora TaxID=2813651 RepID=A0A7C8NHK3_ORBOL|nr:hypothetical protein TWF103_010655 [Orbilia oligospora]KAF3093973.1 hypothetical protein TWF103_010655 [Orbilia oligospora]KAF3101570.1 hypothetical protein TWF102_004817 [Orbilia oligospora]KAF3101571.1 hypothetical protein TWF102_004817 [Orbilia oligospora]KAF3108237.1 hypothetical protein TWF706_002133 [Orbilia oligospora]